MLIPAMLVAVSLIATLMLTGAFRRMALRLGIIDVPSSRSSHHEPTPRGGGVVLIIVVLTGLAVLTWYGEIHMPVFWALGGAGAIVGAAGLLDDLRSLPSRWRLLCHFAGAAWGLYWLGGLPAIVLWQQPVELGLFGNLLALLLLVWGLNLYNFMDGINGIAAIELITVALGGLLAGAIAGAWEAGLLLALLISSGLGVLFWNFPRARVFMGDSGSGFLGLIIGLIAIWQGMLQIELLSAWVILMGCFVVDATLTLGRRVLRGEPFDQPHCSHAYQVAARHFGSHTPVALSVGAINLVWLTPMAVLAVTSSLPVGLVLVVAWLPLVVLAFWFKAGASAE